MGKKSESEFHDIPAFAAASPETQAAIVAAIGDAETVHLYPSRIAYLDVARREDGACGSCTADRAAGTPGWGPTEQDVSRADAAHLLAHNPPPYYTTAAAAKVSGPL